MTHITDDHQIATRRYFMTALAAASTSVFRPKNLSAQELTNPALRSLIKKLHYLTPSEQFGTVERGNPLPYKLPPADLKEAGLTTDTWKLEVVSDVDYPSKMGNQFKHADNTAFTYARLMELANKKGTSFIKTMTCNNMEAPLGTGIWEGVPLRDVIWLTDPKADIRRVFYHGYHNLDPKQMFQSSWFKQLFELNKFLFDDDPASMRHQTPIQRVIATSSVFSNFFGVTLTSVALV